MESISRRQFCLGAGGALLVTGLSTCAMALRHGRRRKIVGIGGAGGNVVAHLREKTRIAERADIVTINDPESREREDVDYRFASGIQRSLSLNDAERISHIVGESREIVLIAGLGGRTGSRLIQHFAAIGRQPGNRVSAIVTVPFEFERRRVAVANETCRKLEELSDRLVVIDNEREVKKLPGETPLLAAFRHIDNLAAIEVLRLLAEERSAFPLRSDA